MKSTVLKLRDTTTTYAEGDAEYGDGETGMHYFCKLEVYIHDTSAVDEAIATFRRKFPEAIIFESEVFSS